MNKGLQRFIIIPGNSPMTVNYREPFPKDFFNAAGSDQGDEFFNAAGDEGDEFFNADDNQNDEFYNAIGDGARARRTRKDKRVTGKANLRDSKGKAMETKANAKLGGSQANILAA